MKSQVNLQASFDDVLLAFNLTHKNLYPVDKLLNKEELYSILNTYQFKQKVYALPYLLFSDIYVEGNSYVKFFYDNEYAFTVTVECSYQIDKSEVAKLMFNTNDITHPGVKKMLTSPEFVIAGKVIDFNDKLIDIPYCKVNTIDNVIFQSRNPPHKAHEEIVKKYAPNMTYSTPYSTVKSSDYAFNLKIKTYEEIARRYGISIYVTTLPRVFAGPREALQNCLLFQNKGAKRFIMGRGKNCIGNFYPDTESYEICKSFFDAGKISIEPIWQETIYAGDVELKGSAIKLQYIDKGIKPPEELISDYISNILLQRA